MIVHKNITLVKCSSGDWEGLYLDNELYREAHSIPTHDIFYLINNHHIQEAKSFEVNEDYTENVVELVELVELVEYHGGYPHYLSEIPEEVRV
jgi:hypothetical protein